MSDEARYLDGFEKWLQSLGADAQTLASLLIGEGVGIGAKEASASGLNYLFKSLDLIPDGIDDIGYLDDAFIIRVAADLSQEHELSDDAASKIAQIAADAGTVREFLGADYVRLENYVKGLKRGAVRGRMVGDIVADPSIRAEFVNDVAAFAKNYTTPSFTKEEKTLVRFKAFLDAKLPR